MQNICYIYCMPRGQGKYKRKVESMPRSNRKKSLSNVYHVINRGINKQDIFLDKQDFLKFIKEVKNTKAKYDYEIYAYAFMNDHVHFIIYDKNENMSIAMQSLNVRYSIYFNKKYDRIGHLFKNRFKSKVVENKEYLKILVRYIHKNPENAGIEPYKWTSYNEYLNRASIICKDRVLEAFGNKHNEAIENFIKFHYDYKKFQDIYNGFEMINKITDEELIGIIKNALKEENPLNIMKYDKIKKDQMISKILKIEGVSKGQIERVTGITRRTILNIEKRNELK